MTIPTIHNQNIYNLTSIWKLIGQTYHAFSSGSNIEWVDMKTKTWPNRLWLTKPVDPQILDEAIYQIKSTTTNLVLPHFTTKENPTEALFTKKGFTVLFTQIGMSLQLKKTFPIETPTTLKRVKNDADAQLWSALFEQSFGYSICPETIAKTCNTIEYYITYSELTPIGSLLLHQTNSLIGVHALGIIPKMRKQGFAQAIMKTVINQAIKNNTKVMTLQASEMGKNMYLNLGFKTDFILNNYGLNLESNT